jgi:hypothetical protein
MKAATRPRKPKNEHAWRQSLENASLEDYAETSDRDIEKGG